MNKMILTLFAVALLVLSACGGGGGSTATTAAAGNTINGVANLGVVINGVVTAFKLTNGVQGTQLGAPATTAANGSFSIDVGAYTGPVVLVLSNPNSNATFLDEATGNQAALAVAAANSTVSSVLSSVAANQTAAITPLTDIVATAAMNSAQNGAADSTAILDATTFVANAFGLNGVDLLVTQPVDLGVSAGAGSAAQYASVLAGIAKVAAANATTASVNNAATPGDKLIAQAKAYANAMFNAQGAPQAPTALTTGDNFTTLKVQVDAFKAAPSAGLQAPAVAAVPTGATYIGSNYYYAAQSYKNADANVDYMERGTLVFNATATTTVTPLEAWDRSVNALANNGTVPAGDLTLPFTEALTVNQSGSWSIASGVGGNISADGMIFAGVLIQNGSPDQTIVYGVKKPATNITKAALAGKVFDFTSRGSAINNAGFVEAIEAIGNITFSANGNTLTYTATETVNGTVGATTTTANIAYTITVDGLIKIVEPVINMVIYVAPSEGGKYAVWTDANYTPADGRQLKSVGFAIARSNVTPSVANTAYNYIASYWASAGLITAASPIAVAGPQVEQGLMAFGANSTVTPSMATIAMQQVTAANTTRACGVAGIGVCTGTASTFTFTGGANGSATMSDGVLTFSGFASADGNVTSFPGIVAIKQ